MRIIKLKCGDIIIVHMAHMLNGKEIGVIGRNLSSPYLRIKYYNNDVIDVGTTVKPIQAALLLTSRVEKNYYQGELKPSKNTTPLRTSEALKEICNGLDVTYKEQQQKYAKIE